MGNGNGHVSVREIMTSEHERLAPNATLEAIALMRSCKVGCLPVVENGYLVGILTAHDFLTASAQLFEEHLGARLSPSDAGVVGVPKPERDAQYPGGDLQTMVDSGQSRGKVKGKADQRRHFKEHSADRPDSKYRQVQQPVRYGTGLGNTIHRSRRRNRPNRAFAPTSSGLIPTRVTACECTWRDQ